MYFAFFFNLNYLFMNECHQPDCKPQEGSTNHYVSPLEFLGRDTIFSPYTLLLRVIIITWSSCSSLSTLKKPKVYKDSYSSENHY